MRDIAGDDLYRSSQFPSVIPVACSAKRTEELMRMRLKHNGPCPYHLSPLPPMIAQRTDLIKPAMGSRQGVRLRQRALAGCLSGSIHINDEPLLACSVKQTARGRKRLLCKQIFLKKRSQGFHRGLI